MNLTLSKRGSYAVRAAVCLARSYPQGRPKKLREISAEMNIPRTFVSQILGDLVRGGIAVSAFGRDGGHRLIRPPDQILMVEVIEAAEGPLAPARCALGDVPCRWQEVCPMHETMALATASLRRELASVSLAQITARDVAIEAGTYPIPPDVHGRQFGVSVSDSVQVELPLATVAARFKPGGSWLSDHSSAADAAERQAKATLAETVAVRIGEHSRADGAVEIPLLWEATGPLGLFPRFEGKITLTALDPDRSELSISGRYRLTPTVPAMILDEHEAARTANRAVRALLRQVAKDMEGELPADLISGLPAGHSARELGGPGFPDHGDPDLARERQLVLHLPGHVPGDHLGTHVVHILRLDHHSQLASCLHREDLLDARPRGGDPLQPLQPLDVGL